MTRNIGYLLEEEDEDERRLRRRSSSRFDFVLRRSLLRDRLRRRRSSRDRERRLDLDARRRSRLPLLDRRRFCRLPLRLRDFSRLTFSRDRERLGLKPNEQTIPTRQSDTKPNEKNNYSYY